MCDNITVMFLDNFMLPINWTNVEMCVLEAKKLIAVSFSLRTFQYDKFNHYSTTKVG